MRRNQRESFHQLVIQKGHSCFQGVGHGHAIDLGQVVIQEKRLCIHIEQPIQWIGVFCDFEVPIENSERVFKRVVQKVAGEELSLFLFVEADDPGRGVFQLFK